MSKRLPKRSKYRKQEQACDCKLCADGPRPVYFFPDQLDAGEVVKLGSTSAAEILRCKNFQRCKEP